MKLKIISDGTVQGTMVVDAETNKIIENIVDIIFSVSASEDRATAFLTISNPVVELNLPRENVSVSCECPHCLCPCFHSQSKGCTDENCEYR